MKLLAFGCSYTEGAHIDGMHTWPYRLSQLINCEVVIKAKGGAGNFYIANQVYNTVHVHNECEYKVHFNCDDSLVMVMWSGIDRVDRAVSRDEFYHSSILSAGRVDPYYSGKNIWLHSGGLSPFAITKARDRYWHNYYKSYHTEEDSYLQTLQHMLGVQEFLINRNIPHLFLTYSDIFTDKYKKYKRAKKLEDNIIWDKFHFPNGKFGGMDEWVREDKLHPRLKFTKDYHPSEKMHHKFAEYLYNLKELRYLFT
jgi:hypothetical protein